MNDIIKDIEEKIKIYKADNNRHYNPCKNNEKIELLEWALNKLKDMTCKTCKHYYCCCMEVDIQEGIMAYASYKLNYCSNWTKENKDAIE